MSISTTTGNRPASPKRVKAPRQPGWYIPWIFVGVFMGLYYSFAVLVVAEMLGAKFGLGWYLQFNTAYSAYANVYAALIVMALICAGLVRLLFVLRDQLLGWQKGIL